MSTSSSVYSRLPSPLGELLVTASEVGLTGLYFPDHRRGPEVDPRWVRDDAAFTDLADQLDRYFAGRLTAFDVPLAPGGTDFQQAVWTALRDVAFGETTTYGALAAAIDRPRAVRAVSGAIARNPLSIVVPCHRVVGASGALTGYAGGVARKRQLLDLESAAPLTVARE